MPFREPTNALFSRYFWAWNRLEARSRRDDFSSGLAASTADPLWALGRQWQMLELKGEDAGTPIHVKLKYEEASLDQIKLGELPFQDIATVPVEVLVEQEVVAWDWRLRVRAGQHFERLARLAMSEAAATALINRLRRECAIAEPPDPQEWAAMDHASRRFVSLMAGRAINGETLLKELGAHGIDGPLQDQYRKWYQKLYSQGAGSASPAWQPERLDYEFRLKSRNASLPGPLHVSSYRNGAVDWDAFALEKSTSAHFEPRPLRDLTPGHVTFAGQPMRRWWEFEDRGVNLGALDVAKTDLAKLILMEFALVFGDDWFVVPLTAYPNTMVKVEVLEVRDCFGVKTVIPAARESVTNALKRWEVFSLAPDQVGDPTSSFLYVPPLSAGREESPVLEEIRFARDEDANTVFAIEQRVPNGLGEPIDGFTAHLETQRRWQQYLGTLAPESDEEEMVVVTNGATTDLEVTVSPPPPKIRYVMATKVPRNWIPFIATERDNLIASVPQRAVKLRRAAIVSTEATDALRPISALSRLINGATPLELINEEAVGREGVRVELRRQRMRSATGETYVWLGRKITVGKGEARSGLRFDAVRPTSTRGFTPP